MALGLAKIPSEALYFYKPGLERARPLSNTRRKFA